MGTRNGSYSPNILIYLLVGEKRVRLEDVLVNTARLYEAAEFSPGTIASLVFSIDGVEEHEDIILDDGITLECEQISFSYRDRQVSTS